MSVTARLAAFGLVLALAFGIGAGLGATFGPDPASPAPKAPMETDGSPPVSTTPMKH